MPVWRWLSQAPSLGSRGPFTSRRSVPAEDVTAVDNRHEQLDRGRGRGGIRGGHGRDEHWLGATGDRLVLVRRLRLCRLGGTLAVGLCRILRRGLIHLVAGD